MSARHPIDDHIAPPAKLAEGTQPGAERVIGQRVSIAYPHVHTRKDEAPIVEKRYAIGKVAAFLPDGSVTVATDRDGLVTVPIQCAEVVA